MVKRVIVGLALFIGVSLLVILGGETVFTISVIVAFGWAFIEWTLLSLSRVIFPWHRLIWVIVGLNYILYSAITLIKLRSLENGLFLVIWLFLIVIATDVGAYFTGRFFGKSRLSKVSPRKTLEGFFGGVILAGFIGVNVHSLMLGFDKQIVIQVYCISFMIGMASQLGDLFESSLKRAAHKKDSGNILGPHGGVLDRLDGHLIAPIAFQILHWAWPGLF